MPALTPESLLSTALTACFLLVSAANGIPETRLVRVSGDAIEYRPYTALGDVVPDFSTVGYHSGEQGFPTVPAIEWVLPGEGNDRHRIQEAIDRVSRRRPDQNGHRGAVQLAPGTFEIDGTIHMTTSGVVLRGSGTQPVGGTTLVATTKEVRSSLIEVEGINDRFTDLSSRTAVTASYVPVGSRRLAVADTRGYTPGDAVQVVRPGTVEWIRELGMNRIPDHPTDDRVISQWDPAGYTFRWDRVLSAVGDGYIVLDAPLTQALDAQYGGGFVEKYSFPGRIQEIGVECLRLVSQFDASIVEDQQVGRVLVKDVFTDENHAWTGVTLSNAMNCWVRDVTTQYFAFGCVHIGRQTKWVTVAGCSNLDPVSKITGGRRYSFYLSGEQSLVRDCFARGGRHDFALNSRVCGPNVFYRCTGIEGYATSEPHHRYSSGVLYDNVTVEGPCAWMMAINRSYAGTGHGWSGAQIIFWNCSAVVIGVQKPPTAQNFAVGHRKSRNADDRALLEYAVEEMNFFSMLGLPANGPFWGDGYTESPDSPVQPLSLYEAQLADHLLTEYKRVPNCKQEKGI